MRDSPVTVISTEQLEEQCEQNGYKTTVQNAFETADEEIVRQIRRILDGVGSSMIE